MKFLTTSSEFVRISPQPIQWKYQADLGLH